MIRTRVRPPGCSLPLGEGPCLPECQASGACRAGSLRFVDGRVLVGRAIGFLGETLRYQAVYPSRGPVLVPFTEAEPLSLHEALRSCVDPSDGPGLLALADVCAARGLVDLALRELDRVTAAAPDLAGEVRERRVRLCEDAARRILKDAREHLAARRTDHARAALEEVLERFPGTGAALEARELRRGLAVKTSAPRVPVHSDGEDGRPQR